MAESASGPRVVCAGTAAKGCRHASTWPPSPGRRNGTPTWPSRRVARSSSASGCHRSAQCRCRPGRRARRRHRCAQPPWAVALKVLQAVGPVGRQPIHLEVAQRKGEPVIDADDRRDAFREPSSQPVRDTASRPAPARAGRLRYLIRRGLTDGTVDAQALETGLGRLDPE